jgi:hypothetical protein
MSIDLGMGEPSGMVLGGDFAVLGFGGNGFVCSK